MSFKKYLLLVAAVVLLAGCSHKFAATQGDIARTLPMPKALGNGMDGDDFGICLVSVMNIREDPAYEAEMGTQMLMGSICWIIELKDGWVMVSTPDGYIAWVTEKSIKETDAAGAIAWKASPRLIVTAHYTPLLSEPRSGSEIIRDAVRGCIVGKLERKGKYYKCLLPDGIEAYVAARDVADCREYFEKQNPAGSDIVADAKLHMGIPYLWGGSSVKGVDCSGLSQRVYMDCGILLPRNASQQARSGDDVDISGGWDNLQPGDLLFFGRPRDDGSMRIYHVAIYIGDGQIIHSAAGKVHTASIIRGRANYYRGCENIVQARRILGNVDSGKAAWSILHNGWYF